MKKLLFFKSSSPHGDERTSISTVSKDNKRHHIDTQWKKMCSENVKNKFQNSRHSSPVSDRKVAEKKTVSRSSSLVLRKSRSLSLSSSVDRGIRVYEDLNESRTHTKFPSNGGDFSAPLCDCYDCHFQLKEMDSKPQRFNESTIHRSDEAIYDHNCPGLSYSSSPHSSLGSTSFPDQVLDLYIDGEYLPEKYNTREYNPHNPAIIGRSNSTKQRSNSSSWNNVLIPSDSASRTSLISNKRPDSPRKVAKQVVERLLRLEQPRDSKTREIGNNWCVENSDETTTLYSNKGDTFIGNGSTLEKKLEEANERVMILTKELSQERPLQYYYTNNSNVKGSSYMIRNLLEREKKLVVELSDQLQCRISERNFAKELTEKNESLQKEISRFYVKEKEYIDKISNMDECLKDMTEKVDVVTSDNDDLKKKLSDLRDELKVSEEVQLCMERNSDEKEKENTGLVKCVTRLQNTCNEQEKTIDGLRQSLSLEMEKQQNRGSVENMTYKLQMEQLRLTEVEQTLRKQIELSTVEIHSLRRENIYLLERLKSTAKVSGHSGIKLDQELLSCVGSLQNTGLTILSESIQMNADLIRVFKSKCESTGFIEAHTLIDYHAKVRGFQQNAEQLARSLRNVESVLSVKTEPVYCELNSIGMEDDKCRNINRKDLEADLKAELKAERLLTSLLKEKLYHKEKEVELIQAELARVCRNVDVLKSEIQDAFDSVSCVNHKMKNLELQMIKKDGTINQLQGEVQSHEEELSATKGIVSKVSQERDMMWEEVKMYSEKNMLLNCEIDSMKKKIETLEEDTLLKDGQISILKDSLSNARPFDVLFTPEFGDSFNM